MFKHFYTHLLFWLIVSGMNVVFMINISLSGFIISNLLLWLFFQGVVFYITGNLLFPRLYVLNRTALYVGLSLLLVLVAAALQSVSEAVFIKTPHLSQLAETVSVERLILINWLKNVLGLLIMAMAATVVRLQRFIEKQNAEKLKTELKLLKVQINPHFLFNALNNIYALIYMKPEKAPESMVKLSRMLRYVIEECEQERVSIRSEIEYIENYIAFQKMKSQDKRHISFDYSNIRKDLSIAPMLFIPLIENSFKYSKIEENPQAFINIELRQDNGEISFIIDNSVPAKNRNISGSGTGINNIKKHLEIIYPGKHSLAIEKGDSEYKVILKIQQ